MNIKNKLITLIIMFLLTIGLVAYKLYDGVDTTLTSRDPIPNSTFITEKGDIDKCDLSYKYISENPDTSSSTYDNNPTDKTIPINNDTPINKTVPANNPVVNKDVIKYISMNDYILNLQTSTYTVSAGDTTSIILRPFEATCNYNTAIKHLKLLNQYLDLSSLEIGSTIKIPTEALKAGHLYKIVSGDTWYKIAQQNYPGYNTDSIIEFLISINALPNKDCPLGENIFLPIL